MASDRELEKKCEELAARLLALLNEVKPEERLLADIGTSSDAIRKGNVVAYWKLGELCKLLRTTPNRILDFPDDNGEKLKGTVEAAGLFLGLPLEKAILLAEVSLSALDSPSIKTIGLPPREAARAVALILMQQSAAESLHKEQK